MLSAGSSHALQSQVQSSYGHDRGAASGLEVEYANDPSGGFFQTDYKKWVSNEWQHKQICKKRLF